MRYVLIKAKRYFELVFTGFVGTRDLLFDWLALPFTLLSSMGIRYKIAATITLILSLTVCSLGFMTFTRQTAMLQEEMQNRAEALVQQLAAVGKEGILTKQELQVYSTVNDIQKKTDVVYAMILDSKGTVFIHNVLSMKGKVLSGKADQMALSTNGLLFQETQYEGQPVLDATYPIVFKPKNIKIGVARIGLSQVAFHAALREQKMLFFWISLSFIGVGVLLSFGLARILTKSIYTLEEGMQRVTQGDLRRQIEVLDKDEIGRLTEAFNQMILSLREKLHMEKYLSRSTVKSIKKNRDLSQLKLGGKKKHVTVLFADVREFTALSERMRPEEVVKLLNIYLNLQGKVIRQWGGVVDKFIGDEVMAIFEGEGSERNAVRAAMDIQRYCASLNWARAMTGEKQLHIGIGLNSGEVVMGNMGSMDQMDYTVIGDNVNIAARLCSIAAPGQIVVSKVIADQLGEDANVTRLDPVLVKGKDRPLENYQVTDVKGAARAYMRQTLEAPCAYRFTVVPYDAGRAIVKNISPSGCLLEVSSVIGVGTRVRLQIEHKCFRNLNLEGIVHRVRSQQGKHYVGMDFNALDDVSKHGIITWMHEIETDIMEAVPSARQCSDELGTAAQRSPGPPKLHAG
jgi:adenylate cyclase